jgi:hypothetical protein
MATVLVASVARRHTKRMTHTPPPQSLSSLLRPLVLTAGATRVGCDRAGCAAGAPVARRPAGEEEAVGAQGDALAWLRGVPGQLNPHLVTRWAPHAPHDCLVMRGVRARGGDMVRADARGVAVGVAGIEPVAQAATRFRVAALVDPPRPLLLALPHPGWQPGAPMFRLPLPSRGWRPLRLVTQLVYYHLIFLHSEYHRLCRLP